MSNDGLDEKQITPRNRTHEKGVRKGELIK